MKILTLAAVGLLVASIALTRGLTAHDSPQDAKGPAVDTSFLKQYAETRGFMLGRPTKPKITPDGKAVLFLRADGKSPKQSLFEFDVATGKTRELLTPAMLLQGDEEKLSPEEKARRERQRVSVGGFTDYFLDPSGNRVLVKLSNRLYVFDRATNKPTELKTGDGGAIVDPKWSPDGTRIAYVRGYDVFVYDLAASKETPVTTGGTAVKTHGLAEFVAQEEMKRDSGFWWSPDGQHIAYAEADHTGVETWYVADPFKPDAKPAEQFYPRPGKKNVSVRLGVIPASGGETVWVEWDRAKWEYLTNVIWQKNGPLTIQVQDRIQRQFALRRVDIATGKTDLIDRIEDWTFLNIVPNSFHYLKGGEGYLVVYQSTHVGNGNAEHAYAVGFCKITKPRFGPGGKEADAHELQHFLPQDSFRQLLSCDLATGEIVVASCLGDDNQFAPMANTLDPTQTVLKRFTPTADPDAAPNGKPWQPVILPVCQEPGVYSAVFNDNQSVYVASKTTLKQLPASIIYKASAERVGTLPSVAVEPPFIPNVKIEKVGDYWTGVVRPRDFDPKKKYPVVVYTYGGPTSQVVTQAMQPWLVRQWLADQGFIVVAIDNRGTAGRGREWEKAVYQKFGTVPLEDQVKGLKALCDKHPEMDRDRVGIFGWSFGGYMAANAVLREPDVYKAAVAGAPVTDWEDYDTHYTERYLGLLPESQAAYDEASLLPLAKTLRRPLLLVHGTADDNVYYRHTLKLSNELIRAGRDFEVMPLPGITHMIAGDPVVMERFYAKTARFFKSHLGEPK